MIAVAARRFAFPLIVAARKEEYNRYDRTMRLLLVEDEPRVARFIAKGLREQSYAVDLAADGDQALYQARENDYDLVILDVMLPVKDGYAVCQDLRLIAGVEVRVIGRQNALRRAVVRVEAHHQRPVRRGAARGSGWLVVDVSRTRAEGANQHQKSKSQHTTSFADAPFSKQRSGERDGL